MAKSALAVHMEDDKNSFAAMAAAHKEQSAVMKEIKENHLAHIQLFMETARNDIEWIKKLVFIITTAVVGGVVGLFFNAFHK